MPSPLWHCERREAQGSTYDHCQGLGQEGDGRLHLESREHRCEGGANTGADGHDGWGGLHADGFRNGELPLFVPTVGMQDDSHARITVGDWQASQRRETDVALRSVWKTVHTRNQGEQGPCERAGPGVQLHRPYAVRGEGRRAHVVRDGGGADEILQSRLNTLKLVLTNSKRPINLGAQLDIMDLMTMSNDMFEEAMKDFPKVKQ